MMDMNFDDGKGKRGVSRYKERRQKNLEKENQMDRGG
jgi:hypothetical protein